ncbi:MAG: prepilin-type N-terminal cleavage/methylation domain-containing protein [Planctomycetes bacterium]|nr:prepilin-type N-terminal cleavage/methylation domain-containing protein [Planctomycetota bacterium]
MTPKHRRLGFTLAELLVVIAIIGILARMLLPVINRARQQAKITVAKSMLSQLETALADYFHDYGVYPPETGSSDLNLPSETLYFYLVGMDIDSPNRAMYASLQRAREGAKSYVTFRATDLEDYDEDCRYEVVDPWGQPWLYIRGMYPGHPGTSSGLGNPTTRRPFHRPSSYDLYSVGPNGTTGPAKIRETADMYRGIGTGFYLEAANQYEDGKDGDDISNFQ